MQKKIIRCYHGSNVEFDIFTHTGTRSTSALGQGHYLTPDVSKAKMYGNIVMAFDVEIQDCLDWNNLTSKERQVIESFLLKHIPPHITSKYGKNKYEVLPLNTQGLNRLEELQELTSGYEADAARAKIVPKMDYQLLPQHLQDTNHRESCVVKWKESGCLQAASEAQLLGLAQEYAPEIAKYLGYKGAMYGNEISIYCNSLATKIGIVMADKNDFWEVVEKIVSSEEKQITNQPPKTTTQAEKTTIKQPRIKY